MLSQPIIFNIEQILFHSLDGDQADVSSLHGTEFFLFKHTNVTQPKCALTSLALFLYLLNLVQGCRLGWVEEEGWWLEPIPTVNRRVGIRPREVAREHTRICAWDVHAVTRQLFAAVQPLLQTIVSVSIRMNVTKWEACFMWEYSTHQKQLISSQKWLTLYFKTGVAFFEKRLFPQHLSHWVMKLKT